MKITLSGVPGSGKSTLRAELAKKYGLQTKATGDFMRLVAKKYGYTDITKFLVEYLSQHPEIDYEVDEEQKKFGEENDNFVLDAHLGFFFVPDSIKVALRCSLEVSAKRILDAKRETEDSKSMAESIQATQQRVATMQQNFLKLYNVNIYDESLFDVVVDTSSLTPQEVFTQVTEYISQVMSN